MMLTLPTNESVLYSRKSVNTYSNNKQNSTMPIQDMLGKTIKFDEIGTPNNSYFTHEMKNALESIISQNSNKLIKESIMGKSDCLKSCIDRFMLIHSLKWGKPYEVALYNRNMRIEANDLVIDILNLLKFEMNMNAFKH
ncbi:MAG: hypothetical protein EKE20_14590 [Candidatus Symbiopectobacterium sp. Dall1.0]|nr:hypothetical protein [Candidatus Symbiopectobacterium sp. Dall1.0]